MYLREMGRVDALLEVRDVMQWQARGLGPEACEEIRAVVARHGGELLSMEAPTTTREQLFLSVVRSRQARPGRRARGATPPPQARE